LSYPTKSIAEEAAIVAKLSLVVDPLAFYKWETGVWPNCDEWHAALIAKDSDGCHMITIHIDPSEEGTTYHCMINGARGIGNAQWSSGTTKFHNNPTDALNDALESFQAFYDKVQDYYSKVIHASMLNTNCKLPPCPKGK